MVLRMLLEILRIIFIFAILGVILSGLLNEIYTKFEAGTYSWLGSVAILLLLFVLYRNKLQFSGWYKGEGRKKLPNSVTYAIATVSVFMIVSPFIVG
ncbi:MAG: hypothetical protein ABS939_23710 [Psychrobacillus sp.]|uniref:hypothetical protein n=1 Tax=Psychrobacillus sp. MER TA 171 TaxID=2939577 RepID=UPI00203BC811|nr:hypothetical protein [Psychrobacillus sp. MER TA 171]MCM3357774.1 hypothetical protein [Psychrobacillus sp. MER TA 171]